MTDRLTYRTHCSVLRFKLVASSNAVGFFPPHYATAAALPFTVTKYGLISWILDDLDHSYLVSFSHDDFIAHHVQSCGK
jgi:hypothetical protein